MVSLARFFGRTASEGAAFALGTAVGPALSPAVREIVNEAWTLHPSHPLSVGDAALIAAEDRAWEDAAREQAKRSGVNEALFDKLLIATREGPGFANAMALWRRGLISEADFDHAMWKAKLEQRYHEPIKALRNVLLSPADLAMMRQQGFIERDRQVNESARSGVDAERADLLFEISGLPPGIEMALEMLRRQIITDAEFARIVREGHTKTKYTDELLALRTPLLASATLVNLYLRGWITRADYHDRMAAHGFTAAQADDWYDSSGRPAAPVQMYTAWARGAPGPYGGTFGKDDFLRGIRQSDIRPEYGETLWHNRYSYPSLFQLRRAVQDGGITRARALTILRYERYEDTDATALVDSWLTGSGTTAKGLTATDLANEYEARWLTRPQYIAGLRELGYDAESAAAKADAEDAKRTRAARNRRVELIGRRYVAHGIGRDRAIAELNSAEVPARVRDSLLPEWDAMRAITPDALTAAQVKKAFKKALLSRAEAIDRLEAKNYDERDANIYLDE